jgi:hypothetical protein
MGLSERRARFYEISLAMENLGLNGNVEDTQHFF